MHICIYVYVLKPQRVECCQKPHAPAPLHLFSQLTGQNMSNYDALGLLNSFFNKWSMSFSVGLRSVISLHWLVPNQIPRQRSMTIPNKYVYIYMQIHMYICMYIYT